MIFWSRSLGKGPFRSNEGHSDYYWAMGHHSCYCKSQRSNENFLETITVLCLAGPGVLGVLHSGVNEALSRDEFFSAKEPWAACVEIATARMDGFTLT